MPLLRSVAALRKSVAARVLNTPSYASLNTPSYASARTDLATLDTLLARVRELEAENEQWHQTAHTLEAERDEWKRLYDRKQELYDNAHVQWEAAEARVRELEREVAELKKDKS